MEIEGEDGSNLHLQKGRKTVFGRGPNYNTEDKTVARQHVSFDLLETSNQKEPRVSFLVIGKNPLWLRSRDGNVKTFGKFEKGEMAAGDCFCVSSRIPVWFTLKSRSGVGNTELRGDFEGFDDSEIDPVQEFGFLLVGHEFDSYPKQRISDAKNWDWFLEEPERDSDGVKMKRKRKTEKKSGENDDDDWTGESEEDMEVVSSSRKVRRPKYKTRSRDRKKPRKGSKQATDSKRKGSSSRNKDVEEDEYEEEDEDDDTLGGFIVGDDDEEEELVESDEDEVEEEEEFVDDDDDDEELDD